MADQSETSTSQRHSDSSPRCSESDSSFCSKNSLDSCQDASVFHRNSSLSGDNFSASDSSPAFEYKRQGSDSSVASGSGNSSPLLSSGHSVVEENNKPWLTSTPNMQSSKKSLHVKSGLTLGPSQDRSLSKSPEMGSLQSIKKSRSMSADSPLLQSASYDPTLERSLSSTDKKPETGETKQSASRKAQLDVPPPSVCRLPAARLSHSFNHRHHYRRPSSCSSANGISSLTHPSSKTDASKGHSSPPSIVGSESSNETNRITAANVAMHKVRTCMTVCAAIKIES